MFGLFRRLFKKFFLLKFRQKLAAFFFLIQYDKNKEKVKCGGSHEANFIL